MMENYHYMTLNQFRALVKKTQFPRNKKTLMPNKTISRESVIYETQNILNDERLHSMRYLYDVDNQDVHASCIINRFELGEYPKPSKAIVDSVWLHIALIDQVSNYLVNIDNHGIHYQSVFKIKNQEWYTAIIYPDKEKETKELLSFWKNEKRKEEGTHNHIIFYTCDLEQDNYKKAEMYDFQGTGNHVCLFGISFDPENYSVSLKGKRLF